MPVLSICFGLSEVSFLYFDQPSDFRVFNYPYIPYDAVLLKDLLQLLEKTIKVKYTECDVVTCGFPQVLSDFLNPKLTLSLDTLFSKMTKYHGIFVGNFTVVSPLGYLSSSDVSDVEGDDLNSLYNLILYHQIIQTDSFDQLTVDHSVRYFPAHLTSFDGTKPVVFTGDRFNFPFKYDVTSYLLMLDLLKSPGVFKLQLDNANTLSGLTLIDIYNRDNADCTNNYNFENIGTLINSPGSTECLVETEDGTSQMIEVPGNDIFILPMDSAASSRILLKNTNLGTLENRIQGGRVGMIIDTRAKNDPKVFTKAHYAKSYKSWVERLNEALCTYL